MSLSAHTQRINGTTVDPCTLFTLPPNSPLWHLFCVLLPRFHISSAFPFHIDNDNMFYYKATIFEEHRKLFILALKGKDFSSWNFQPSKVLSLLHSTKMNEQSSSWSYLMFIWCLICPGTILSTSLNSNNFPMRLTLLFLLQVKKWKHRELKWLARGPQLIGAQCWRNEWKSEWENTCMRPERWAVLYNDHLWHLYNYHYREPFLFFFLKRH